MALPRVLLADSGSTKTTWCLLSAGGKKIIHTQGISPYFLTAEEIRAVLEKELLPSVKCRLGEIQSVFYYGTGMADVKNARLLKNILQNIFQQSDIQVTHDLEGAARALCGHSKGLACILGTGSSSCYYNGSKIAEAIPGLGFILGDEGSGAFLGRKVIQYYLYRTFDADLHDLFEKKYKVTKNEILENVYKKPYPNRYLASFSPFLAENRGHFMIENILEDGINAFFFQHISKYAESRKYPVHFTGGVAWAYKDVVLSLCRSYELEPGNIIKAPIDGLILYHGRHVKTNE